jgi:Ca2+-binding RTX toxin-like protein
MTKRRAILSLTTMVTALLVGSGVALAANVILCPGGGCPGTTGHDAMTGTSGTDYLYADEGNDTLRGLGAFDDLRGEEGNDDLNGGGGNDQYNFSEVNWGADRISADSSGAEDWLIFHIASGAVTVDLIPSPNRNEVSSGTNKINFAQMVVIEWVQGGPDSDTIKGNDARNYLSGAGGNDTLAGRKGNDRLVGDIVEFGNNGNDILNGGPGRDILNGGPGNDTFFAKDGEADVITCGDGGDVVYSDPSLDSRSFDCIDFIGP